MNPKREAKLFLKRHYRLMRMARTLLKRKSPISNTPFFSIGDAFQLLVQSIESKIPNEFDCLVGIPRAGLLFANILASVYGRPLATPEGFVRGEVWYAGECIIPKYFKKVLVIEDSLLTGKQLKLAVEKLKDFKPEMEVKTASLFKKTGHDVAVDYVLVQHDCWTIGEWNLLTSLGFMGRLGVDLDGVLGEDCPTNVDDDGVQYCDWLSRAKPLFIPQFKVEAVITSRLEKYRPETEAWLRRHGVRYKVLIMLDLPSIKERTFNIVVRHKANAIRHADLEWYWESNWKEAEQIHRKTKLPILCTSNMRLVGDPRKIAPPRLETRVQESSFERVYN